MSVDQLLLLAMGIMFAGFCYELWLHRDDWPDGWS